jgi:hypothetical protein
LLLLYALILSRELSVLQIHSKTLPYLLLHAKVEHFLSQNYQLGCWMNLRFLLVVKVDHFSNSALQLLDRGFNKKQKLFRQLKALES